MKRVRVALFADPAAEEIRAEPPHILLGRRGEDLAARYLVKKGYRICARNVRLGKSEIDIIAFDPVDAVLVFVEVKAKQTLNDAYLPSMNAGARKWQFLRRGIQKYIAEQAYDGGYRIDLISVTDGKVLSHAKAVGGVWSLVKN